MPARTYHYGDFPELFWDARPEAVLDPASPAVLARVLTRGSHDAMRALLDLPTLRAQFPKLLLPEHTRYFWAKVLGVPHEGPSFRPPHVWPW